MKSKRAKEYIKTIELNKANVDYCLDHGRVSGFLLIDIENAVELAERDAEEEVTRCRKELEESKKREELARKVIDDQRKELEKLKERAVETYRTHCRRYTNPCVWVIWNKCPDTCAYLQDFIQKLNER